MDLPLEIKVIKNFFKKEKQARYIQFVSSSKNRKKFIDQLTHLTDLKWELFSEVSNFNLSLIHNKENTYCYVISEDDSIDGNTIHINDLENIRYGYAMILVFDEGRQIYWEGEPPYNRYISQRV